MKKIINRKIIKAAICLILASAMIFSEYSLMAASAATFKYDDWGSYPASPAPTHYNVVWYEPEAYNGFEKESKYFEIKLTVKGEPMSIYLTLPNIGGFRLMNEKPIVENAPSVEKTGVWEPESNLKIKYTNISGNISMTGADGTRVVFIEKSDSWKLEVYDDENIRLFSITPSQIFFGYQKDALVKTKLEMPLATSEVIYGSGERFSGLNLVGKKTVMWNSDACYHGPALGDEEYNGGTGKAMSELWRGYKNIPIFHSNRGYSMFYNSYSSGEIDVGYTNSKKYTLDFSDSRMDFYLWAGNTSENLIKYTDLTGKAYLPSKWAFQYQAGGSNGFWGLNDKTKQIAVAQQLIDCYEELGTPLNTVYIEGVSHGNAAVYNMLKTAGARLLQWNNADCISVSDAANYFGDLSSKLLPFARNKKNKLQTVGNWVDYTDPRGIELLKYVKSETVNWGILGGMCDFAELIPANSLFSNGLTGDKMHNFYTYFYAKAYNNVMGELTNNDWFCYIRGASAGVQKYIGAWSGDQYNTFAQLKMQLSAGLSIGTSGFSVWGTDMGGLDGLISDDIYNRALIFGLFMPIMRTGGSQTKLPTDFSKQVQNTYKQAYWLRESLLNKLYSAAIDSHTTGLPMMQALGLAFPDDLDLYEIEHEYVFCDDFLVSTVFKSEAYYSDEVILPDGTWYDFWTGEAQSGGKTISSEAPYNQMPVYVKSGAVVPMTLNESLDFGASMKDADTVETLLVTPPDSIRSSVYNKDEDTSVTYISAPVSSDTFRIQAEKGNDAKCIVALGVPAYSVTVDGKKLTRLTSAPENADTVGYFVDSKNRTNIYLGTNNWKTVDIQFGKIANESGNLVVSFTDDAATKALLKNMDFTNTYAISIVNDRMLTAELSKKTSIGKIIMRWTTDYAESYDVQVSNDGANWTTVKSVNDGLGGIETILLSGVEGKYVRIANTIAAGGGIKEPTLYSFEVYRGEDIIVAPSEQPVYNDDVIADEKDIEDEYEETVLVKKRKKKTNSGEEWITILGLPIWLFFIIVGAVVVLLGGGITAIVIVKKKKKKLSEPSKLNE